MKKQHICRCSRKQAAWLSIVAAAAATAVTGTMCSTVYAGSGMAAAGNDGNQMGYGPGYVRQETEGLQGIGTAARWQYREGHWYFYYLSPEGRYGPMAGGWLWVDGACYYFYEDGKMAVAGVTPDGWQVSGSGAWMEQGKEVLMPGKGILTRQQDGQVKGTTRIANAGGGGSGGNGGSGTGSGGGHGTGGGSSHGTGGGSSSGGSENHSEEETDTDNGADNSTENGTENDSDINPEEPEDPEEPEEPPGEDADSPEDDPSQTEILQQRLEDWKEQARAADFAITGIDNPLDQSFLVRDKPANDRRMKNLVSMISDLEPHKFYMIGVDYQADTLILGQIFREQIIYSNTIEDSFTIHGVTYTISRIGIQKIQNPPDGDITEDNTTEEPDEEEPEEDRPSQGMHYGYGDTLVRDIGGQRYKFRCIDEDYRDATGNYRGTALFLCDTVIRADVESDDTGRSLLNFGSNNNYKKSEVRTWLNENTSDSQFPEEPVSIGVNQAYGGQTEPDSWEQMHVDGLSAYPIDWQKMSDGMFLLSVEEAMEYAEELWRFEGSESNNPEEQYSPYSKGYYLRTPLYEADEDGKFCYGDSVYIVDLLEGNIHATDVSHTTIGLRPAFAITNQ